MPGNSLICTTCDVVLEQRFGRWVCPRCLESFGEVAEEDKIQIGKMPPLKEVARKNSLSDIVSPDAPITTNAKGGSQSDIPVRFDLIDAKAMFEMAKVLDHGARKYGADNWRKIDIPDHLNHLLMHTFAYLAGDTTDEHLSHILCRATFALGVAMAEPVEPVNEPWHFLKTETEKMLSDIEEVRGWSVKSQSGEPLMEEKDS